MQKTASETQDKIFRKMSANRKIKLGSDLWKLAKELSSDKIDFRINKINGSTASVGKNS